MATSAKNLNCSYNKETNVVAILTHEGTDIPKVEDVLHSLYHQNQIKLAKLAKIMGVRPCKVFKAMFNRNRADAHDFQDRIIRTGTDSFDFNLPSTITETAVITPDEVVPVVSSAEATGKYITVIFNDINNLNVNKVPPLNKFEVLINSVAAKIARIQIPKDDKKIVVVLSDSNLTAYGDTINIAYTKPDNAASSLQDRNGNMIASFTTVVTNSNAAPEVPNENPVGGEEGGETPTEG